MWEKMCEKTLKQKQDKSDTVQWKETVFFGSSTTVDCESDEIKR